MTPTPTTPNQTYRGDHYRLNYTAGTILTLLADYGTAPEKELCNVLQAQNDAAGIPGGPAGSQWTPPSVKATNTYKDTKLGYRGAPKLDKDDVETDPDTPPIPNLEDPLDIPDVEYYEDTLRPHCTMFETRPNRITTILKMLDYARLINYTGTDADITDLGKAVAQDMRNAETNLRTVGAAHGTMTPTQNYLVGDPRDHVTGAHTIPFTALPLSITYAVDAAKQLYTADIDHDAEFKSLTSNYYSHAVKTGIEHPEIIIDPGTDTTWEDGSLPIRRNLQRQPSYRQFVWLLHNNKNVFVLAYVGVTEETVRLIGNKSELGDAETIAANPLYAKIKEARNIVRKTQKFAAALLTGGPEAVWAGKPIRAKDVHADVTAFIAANRPGFTDAIALGSSLAWETYEKLHLTIADLEEARSALYEGFGRGLIAENEIPLDTDIDAQQIAANSNQEIADNPNAERHLTITNAEKYVQRTADKVLLDIGLDIEINPVMNPAGVPMDIMCRHTNSYSTKDNKNRKITRCNGHSIGGSGYCEKHGGTYLNPEETESLIRASQQKLFAGASKATEVVLELMLTSTNDAIRLRAAEQVLNRAGLSENRDLTVKIDDGKDTLSPGQLVRERIMGLARVTPAEKQAIEESRTNGTTNDYGQPETIDAEVVEDSPTGKM